MSIKLEMPRTIQIKEVKEATISFWVLTRFDINAISKIAIVYFSGFASEKESLNPENKISEIDFQIDLSEMKQVGEFLNLVATKAAESF